MEKQKTKLNYMNPCRLHVVKIPSQRSKLYSKDKAMKDVYIPFN